MDMNLDGLTHMQSLVVPLQVVEVPLQVVNKTWFN
jgi:hypothetical protein